jgi:hydroxymethylglutaryl-CoA reductase (NADPH)
VPSSRESALHFIKRLRGSLDEPAAAERLASHRDEPRKPQLRLPKTATPYAVGKAWDALAASTDAAGGDRALLADPGTLEQLAAYRDNIENMIGTVKVPVGIAGPLRVNGLHAAGDYYVPLATTEGALVASYARGSFVVTRAGGAAAAMLSEGMIRSPGFAFRSLLEAGTFAVWAVEHFAELKAVAETTTRHGKLVEAAPHIEGDHVYLLCRYTTGDAAGQNMVTIATEVLCRHACEHAPVKPEYWFVEANFSGDKKASALAFVGRRGRTASATVELDRDLVAQCLHTTPERMHDYWRMSALGGVMSGTIGVQGHYANGLAALYLATGQDVACVAESAVGVTRMELRGDVLFVAVTLPSLVLGTVGGGTKLPSQSAGLRLMGLEGAGKAPALAEVAAALCLAGEISIIGALAAGHFTRAHRKLARGQP